MSEICPLKHYQPWSRREERLLGTDSDRAIAERLGRTQRAVETHRLKRGVPPHTPRKRSWSAREIRLLGTLSDAKLAERSGVSRRCVMMERRRRGVVPYSIKNRPRHLGLVNYHPTP